MRGRERSAAVPPYWIVDHAFRVLCQTYSFHQQEVRKLNAAVRKRYADADAPVLDWSQQETRYDALVLCGLWHADFVHGTFWSHLSYLEVGFDGYPSSVAGETLYKQVCDHWMAEFTTDEHRVFVAPKKKEAFAYYDDEEAYFGSRPATVTGPVRVQPTPDACRRRADPSVSRDVLISQVYHAGRR